MCAVNPVRATLVPNGPVTETFGRPEFFRDEDVGVPYWCEECHEHHQRVHRVFDSYGELSAFFSALTGGPFNAMFVTYDDGTEEAVSPLGFVPNGGDAWIPVP